jgi:hypothetical protein
MTWSRHPLVYVKETTMTERISTVEALDALPNGSIIVLAENSGPYDVYVKDDEGGWEQDPGEFLIWRSPGDDGVPRSTPSLAEDAMKYGFLVIGQIDNPSI